MMTRADLKHARCWKNARNARTMRRASHWLRKADKWKPRPPVTVASIRQQLRDLGFDVPPL